MTAVSLTKLPNVEFLLTTFLRQDADMIPLFGDDVYTELPADFADWPALRVMRVGGSPPFPRPLAIDNPLVQFDVWGGPKVSTLDAAETVRAVLDAKTPWTLPGKGTLGGVLSFGSLRYLPDSSWDPARPRYQFDAVFVTRP